MISKTIRTLIVDDEPLARKGLRRLLLQYSEIEVIGEADSVESAVTLIKQFHPDLVFLDIQMPGESGFNLLPRVDTDLKVVFVTAFDNYALRAFEVNALDYILKPIDPARLTHTIERLLNSSTKVAKVASKFHYEDYIFIKADYKTGFVKIASISYIVVSGDYSEVYTTDGEKRLVLRSLREWGESLPNQYFLRIHRTTMININYVEKVIDGIRGAYQIYLRGIPTPFTTSRKYAGELRKRFSR